MSTPVKLYVYDLSNGMARQLSRQLTGRQIDGIWYLACSIVNIIQLITSPRHTSVVAFGKEVFYGQGINMTAPGRSHASAQSKGPISNTETLTYVRQ